MANDSTMTSNVIPFDFEGKEIRTLLIEGEPWFIARDVCSALGLVNSRKSLTALDEDEKGVTSSDTLGGQQNMAIINESGLYTLILRCRDAVKRGSVPHQFRKWVTSEVLPSIRKTGGYGRPDEDRLNAAYALASQVAAQASRTVFKAVMEGDDSWRHGRWVFALAWNGKDDWDAPWAKAIDNDAMVGTPEELAKMIEGPDLFMDTHRLATLGSACAARVARTLVYQAGRDAATKSGKLQAVRAQA